MKALRVFMIIVMGFCGVGIFDDNDWKSKAVCALTMLALIGIIIYTMGV